MLQNVDSEWYLCVEILEIFFFFFLSESLSLDGINFIDLNELIEKSDEFQKPYIFQKPYKKFIFFNCSELFVFQKGIFRFWLKVTIVLISVNMEDDEIWN